MIQRVSISCCYQCQLPLLIGIVEVWNSCSALLAGHHNNHQYLAYSSLYCS